MTDQPAAPIADPSPRRPAVYLAGPDVFLDNAAEIGAAKVAICARHGLVGLFPGDTEVVTRTDLAPLAMAEAIYRENVALMDRADAVIANITAFRGPNADDGTAFEIGYAAARGLVLALYDNGAGDTASKTRAAPPAGHTPERYAVTEDFGLPANLMLAVAAADSLGTVTGDEGLDVDALERFEEAVRRVAARLGVTQA